MPSREIGLAAQWGRQYPKASILWSEHGRLSDSLTMRWGIEGRQWGRAGDEEVCRRGAGPAGTHETGAETEGGRRQRGRAGGVYTDLSAYARGAPMPAIRASSYPRRRQCSPGAGLAPCLFLFLLPSSPSSPRPGCVGCGCRGARATLHACVASYVRARLRAGPVGKLGLASPPSPVARARPSA